MDGLQNFMFFLTEFESYKDRRRVIMKDCVPNGTPFMVEKISASSRN